MTFRMHARGPFSLASAIRFVEGFPAGQGAGGDRLDLAFPAEGTWATVGVRVTGDLSAEVVHNPGGLGAAPIREQVERILSLDVDGSGFPAVGARDPVVAQLQARFPGLRPVAFHSPYEAAAWTIIGQRIRMTQAAAVKNRLAERLGERVDFGDRTLPAFPAPEILAGLGDFPGLTDRKVEQLRALGRAAAGGELTAADLRARPVDEALARVQQLPGIGPFSAELILLRGAGHPDVFPVHEKRIQRAMADRYGLRADPPIAELAAIADGWRPYRTWVCLLLRAAAVDP
jgi:DNA-3-methyladenine glycosylase II